MKFFLLLFSTALMVYPSGCEKDGRDITMNKKFREPAVAGTFYPGDAGVLKSTLEDLFSKAEMHEIKGAIVALISPHAGYPYSGGTAAKGYKQLKGRNYETVILIGPSHRALFDASSVYKEGGWKTPLGTVLIDEEIAQELIEEDESIDFYPQAHLLEHSLEVQIPFLQTILKDFKIVPIIMGNQSSTLCEKLAEAIVKVCKGKNVLLVASTDLYHGNSYEECHRSDSQFIKAVKKFDTDGFKKLYTATSNIACGAGPTYTVLLAAKSLGASRSILMEHTTSGDVTGDKSGYIVGYSSFVLAKETDSKNEILSKEEKIFLMNVARKSIEAAVGGQSIPEFSPISERIKEPRGLFVTLTKQGNLRGCIGYIQPIKPMYEAVSEMAISAALKDPRFPPVSEKEMSELSIEISVLTPLEKIDNPEKITVGRDGIFIKKGFYSGLLLPQVATEYGWDRKTFLIETCHKAGLQSDAYKDPETEIFIFQALIFNEEEL
jgi:AmmeMemoRadiSam system protein B/AmmeMemoRadiSam system protein A